MTHRGTEEVGSVYYGPLNQAGAVGFRPAMFGRFRVQELHITVSHMELVTDGGTVRVPSNLVTCSYSLA